MLLIKKINEYYISIPKVIGNSSNSKFKINNCYYIIIHMLIKYIDNDISYYWVNFVYL